MASNWRPFGLGHDVLQEKDHMFEIHFEILASQSNRFDTFHLMVAKPSTDQWNVIPMFVMHINDHYLLRVCVIYVQSLTFALISLQLETGDSRSNRLRVEHLWRNLNMYLHFISFSTLEWHR